VGGHALIKKWDICCN